MEEFRKALLEVINTEGVKLPLDAAYYVMKDVFRDLSDTYMNSLNMGIQVNTNNKVEENKEE